MSAPTKTRQEIRRIICENLEMEFHERWDQITADSVSGATVVASELTQYNSKWQRDWALAVSGDDAGEFRRILDSYREGTKLELESAFPNFTTGDAFEILSGWSPKVLHSTINQAIRRSRGYFFRVENAALVHQEDVLTHDLTSISPTPWLVQKVWMERPYNVNRGEVSAAGSNYVEIDGANFDDDEYNGFLLTVYKSDDAGGEIGTIADTLNGDRLEISGTWGTTPSVGDKVAWYDTSIEDRARYEVPAIDWPKGIYWPGEFQLRGPYTGSWGVRIILEYVANVSELDSESDTTVVPIEYLDPAVRAELWSKKRAKTSADQQIFRRNYLDLAAEAESKMRELAFQLPSETFWQREDMVSAMAEPHPHGDPLNMR